MKLNIRRLINLALLLALFINSTAQPFNLKIGAKFPEMDFAPLINYSTGSMSYSKISDKLLILDFWATTCHPCVASFPKLKSLQMEFGDKIQILPVTTEKKEYASWFLKKVFKDQKMLLPSVTDGIGLFNMFPHGTVPHSVWIYKGNVIAISEGFEVNKANITTALETGKVSLRLKDDYRPTTFDRSTPMMSIGYNIKYVRNDSATVVRFDTAKVKYYSVVTRDYTENDPGFCYPDGLAGNGVTIGNCLITTLFLDAFGEFNSKYLWENRLSIETKDSAMLDPHGKIGLEAEDWMNQGNSYSYELKVPPELFDQRFKIMQEDLNRYFGMTMGIVGDIEKRLRPCLVLKQIDSTKKYLTKGGKNIVVDSAFHLKLRNVYMDWLIERLKSHHFNETKEQYYSIESDVSFEQKVDIDLEGTLTELDDVNEQLKKYGLVFVKENRQMDVVVIKDKK